MSIFRLPILFLLVLFSLSGCSDFKQQFTDLALNAERSRAGLTQKSLDVDGMKIVYLESAEAPNFETMVLIHGFAANKDNWVRFAGQFEDQYHVIVIDLPGHGESSTDLDRSYTYNDQVGYLHDILAKLNVSRFHLAGNSMGGGISALYAAQYPEQVASLTLFDPAGVFQFQSELAVLVARSENPLIVRNVDDFDKLMDFALEEKPFVPWPVSEVMAERSIAHQQINDKIWKDIQTLNQQSFLEALPRIKSPTLVIWGKEDRAINYKNADIFIQKISQATLVLLDNIGHAPMIEIPARSADIMREFIQRKPQA